MTDPEIEIIVSNPHLDRQDLAFAVMAGGIVVAFWAGIPAWLGPTVLTVIAIVGTGVALGAGACLAVDRCFNQRSLK